GGDSPRVNLVQVNGDQNLSRVGQEDAPLDVAATALAQDSEARVLDGPTAGSLVRRDLRVNPVSDEVVLDRLVHGPLTGHRDDQLAQVLDLVELDLGGVHAVPANLLGVAVEADDLLKVVLVGGDVLGLLGPRHRRSPEATEHLFQPLLSFNGGQRVLVLLEVVLLPLVLGHLAQREAVLVVEALEVGLLALTTLFQALVQLFDVHPEPVHPGTEGDSALNLVLPLNVRVLVVVVPDLVLQETGRLQVAVKVGLQLFLGDEVESPVLGLQAAKVVGLALVAVALGGLVETVVTRLHALGIGRVDLALDQHQVNRSLGHLQVDTVMVNGQSRDVEGQVIPAVVALGPFDGLSDLLTRVSDLVLVLVTLVTGQGQELALLPAEQLVTVSGLNVPDQLVELSHLAIDLLLLRRGERVVGGGFDLFVLLLRERV